MAEFSEGNRGIDARVGGLVWVRRRNGSWWPGRIMGMDELPESCLVSPRSGTPVKLLGREDGSIDWYNLERSKRVKAFRCGEYEDAIEKAKAAAANLSKKTVKYARREDAILHALRLESSCLGNEQNGIPISDSPASLNSGREADIISEHHTDSDKNFTLMPELCQSSLSSQELIPSTRRRTPNDSAVEEYKRMRGLEDLACSSNNPINGFKDHSLPLKRKRSQVAVVHDYLKRKDRRRPLTKVLESTAMLSAPDSSDRTECPKWASPAASLCKSGLEFRECNGNGSIIVDMSNFNGSPMDNWEHALQTDGVDDIVKTNECECPSELPENEEYETFLEAPSFLGDKSSTDSQPAQLSSGETRVSHLNGHSIELDQVNCAFLLSDGLPESSPHSAAVHSDRGALTAERGTSEWSSKGKRNSRQLARKQSLLKYFDFKEEPNIQSLLQTRKSPPLNPHPSPKTDEHPVGSSGSDSALYNVDLEVKTGSHRPPHVPLVSLMSKLNGKAVIGHPLSVEVLDDGKSNQLISGLPRDTIQMPVQGTSETVYRNTANKKQKDQLFSSRKSKKRKRRGGALSKKMRKLSSLTGKKGRSKSGKIAADKTVGPVVACIPVKVVFSRISEAVNSSTRSSTMTNRV